MPIPPRVLVSIVGGVIALAILFGCGPLGAVAEKVTPAPTIPAQYKPDARPLLVLVDVADSYATAQIDADRLARMVSREFEGHNIAPVISQDRLQMIRDIAPQTFRQRSIESIAQELGAGQVLAIRFDGIALAAVPGGDSFKGAAAARVRLIDVATRRAVFPSDLGDGAIVSFTSPDRRSDKATAATVRSETLVGLARNIGRLFRDYSSDEITNENMEALR